MGQYWGPVDFGLLLLCNCNSPFFFWQSLLAALGSIQFVSNIAFAYFVLKKTVTVKYVILCPLLHNINNTK